MIPSANTICISYVVERIIGETCKRVLVEAVGEGYSSECNVT